MRWCETADIDGTPCAKELGHSGFHEAPGRRWERLGPAVALESRDTVMCGRCGHRRIPGPVCIACVDEEVRELRREMDQLRSQVSQLTRERDEARREVGWPACDAVLTAAGLPAVADGKHAPLSVRVQKLVEERDELLEEVAGRIADMSEARAESARLRTIAQDYLALLRADGAECTCAPEDTCPLCRVTAALSPAPGGPTVSERERAARIAETHPLHPSTRTGERQRWLRESIAAAIRGEAPEKASQA